jgi:hypothetical protein
MDRLRRIVEGTDTWQGRVFDFVVQALIIVSLVTFSLETSPGLSGWSSPLDRAWLRFRRGLWRLRWQRRGTWMTISRPFYQLRVAAAWCSHSAS